MKKLKQNKKGLSIKKFSIARIDNLSKVKGGIDECTDQGNGSLVRTDGTMGGGNGNN